MSRRGRGGACCGGHGGNDQAGADGSALDGERDEQCVDGAPQPRGRPRRARLTGFTGSQASRRLGQAGERGRDGSRIIMTVESTSRLPAVAEMSRVRWPSSPTASSCGCLHRGSNAQAVSKTCEAARSHVLMSSASCVARRPARLGGHLVGAGAGADGARVRVCTCSMCTGLARSGKADRKLRALHAGRAGGTPASVPGLEEVHDEVDREVDRLARALVPRRVHGDVCAWVWIVWSGVCVGAAVLISRGAAGGKRAGLGRRSHLELKRRLHLELNGVGFLFVDQRCRQGDDEW